MDTTQRTHHTRSSNQVAGQRARQPRGRDSADARPPEHIDTVVVGGGQAGLAAAHHLTQREIPCLVLDAAHRIGDQWRHTWDSLRLYSPALKDGLPGMPFPGDPHHFPTKDEMGDYLDAYAAHSDLPVRTGVRVERLSGVGDGFALDVSEPGPEGERLSRRITADHVIVATGSFGRTPRLPATAADLDPRIVQVHSQEYRRPDQLPPGPVLVVGASHSGFDIAFEVAATHQTVLVGHGHGSLPVRPEDPAFRVLFPLIWQVWGHVLSIRTPKGRKERVAAREHGAPALRVKPSDLQERGVRWVEQRVTGARDGLPQLEDGEVVDVASVVWATGFRQRFDWIDLDVLGEDGWPKERRGVTDVPGLYFTGLCFQTSFRSMLIGGAGADAAEVVRHLARHRRGRPATRGGAEAHAAA